MTRLCASDVLPIISEGKDYDILIKQALGLELPALAARVGGLEEQALKKRLRNRRAAVISISSGGGVVEGFAHSVANIVARLGLQARVMAEADEAGFAEARAWGAEILLYADDDHFVAQDLAGGFTADNNPGTSLAYAAALEAMAGGLKGRDVLLLGLGVIGRGAVSRLVEMGAAPLLYDLDIEAAREALESGAELVSGPEDLQRALRGTDLIYEATPVAEALAEALWPEHPVVAAPGVPLSWPRAWLKPGERGRLWHDPLQSGVAGMLGLLAAHV